MNIKAIWTTLVGAIIAGLLFAGAVSIHQRSFLAGHEAGTVKGRMEMLDLTEKQSREIRDEKAEEDAQAKSESEAFRAKAQDELARLGRSEQRAKQELASYLAEKKKALNEQDSSCRSDRIGISRIDDGIVRMLNEARDRTSPGVRSGGAGDPQPADRANGPSTAPAPVKWEDLAQSDLDAVEGYTALAARHDKLTAWVNKFCSNKEKVE